MDGSGSKWTNNGSLVIGGHGLGNYGSGTLNITNGGVVTATSVLINSQSLLAMDVGNGSLLSVGNGTFTNGGTVRLAVGASAVGGVAYTPISALNWSGSGTYETIGGTWNANTHQFTASAVETGTSGTAVNLNGKRRVMVSDSGTGGTGWSVGASFAADSTPQTLTATAISGTTLTSLKSLLITAGESLLAGWTFSAEGYTSGNPVYLSLKVGSGYSLDNMGIWHYSGSSWSEYACTDLTYDGTYASFTVTGFSGYAVSGLAVPEPGTLALLTAGLLGLLAYAWRRRM